MQIDTLQEIGIENGLRKLVGESNYSFVIEYQKPRKNVSSLYIKRKKSKSNTVLNESQGNPTYAKYGWL